MPILPAEVTAEFTVRAADSADLAAGEATFDVTIRVRPTQRSTTDCVWDW